MRLPAAQSHRMGGSPVCGVRARVSGPSWEASPFLSTLPPTTQEAPRVEGGCGQSGGSGPRSPDGLHPFSLGGKTPFQSFLGMAQQHSSHNGVSQGWGAGAGGRLAGATGQGQASASGALSLVLGPTQAPVQQAASPTNPTAISPDEYFDPNFSLESRNIGRPIEMSSKVQR